MIHVSDVTKSYGSNYALRGISFDVQAGEIVGLLGPNGAGKTTTIKILTGYLQPDAGVVRIDGIDVLTHPREVQARIGYLPENTPLYHDMSVQGYLKLMADMRSIPADEQHALISQAIVDTGLVEHRHRPIAQLSKGLRQRVGLAQAILHRPKLIILDEPTVGLDPTQIIEIRRLIKRLAEHSTILFSSHILSEVQAVCDRVIILINGRVRADALLSELEATTDAVVVLDHAVEGAEAALAQIPGVVAIEPLPNAAPYVGYRLATESGADVFPLIYKAAKHYDWPLRELRREVMTLEAVFNHLANTPYKEDEVLAEPETTPAS